MTDPASDPVVLVLPRLAGSRAAARGLVKALGTIAGRDLVVDTRELRTASPTFVEELVGAIRVGLPESLHIYPAHPDLPGLPVADVAPERQSTGVQESVRVLVDHDEPGWLGNARAVTLDLMLDGTVRWRRLERAGVLVADEPGVSELDAIMGR